MVFNDKNRLENLTLEVFTKDINMVFSAISGLKLGLNTVVEQKSGMVR
jgi:hypothetical protein